MIPKIIHWCWFGNNKPSNIANMCYQSWKKYCPDYQIKLWNEDNFNIKSCKYVEQAYNQKKWAFVTDYVRLYALYHEGGIYMDSDVEVIQNIDKFLTNTAFSGFESDGNSLTGIFASIKNGKFVKELLDEYTDRNFINPDGSLNQTTNVVYTNRFFTTNGIDINQREINIPGYVRIYPVEYFCPTPGNHYHKTENTHTLHHFCGSWVHS